MSLPSWISLPLPSPSHPSRWSQSTGFVFPVAYTELPLAIYFTYGNIHVGASLVAQSLKNLPAVQESQVLSLGKEDPLEKEMATHSSILAWKISWTEEPDGL